MELNPYSRYLAGSDPLPVIASTADALKRLLDELPGERRNRRPAPDKWSPREIVAHLADCEMVFGFRLRQALSQPHAIIRPFDQEAWSKRYETCDYAESISTFAAVRSWNLRLIEGLTPEDRQRPTTHPERGAMTLWTIVETMAGHDLNHLQQIQKMVRPA